MSQLVNQLTGFLLTCFKKSNILQDVCVEGAVPSQLRVAVSKVLNTNLTVVELIAKLLSKF